jgi:hypothetical protein
VSNPAKIAAVMGATTRHRVCPRAFTADLLPQTLRGDASLERRRSLVQSGNP